MKTHKREFGDWGERVAAWYLQKKGYRLVAKNVLYRDGEIDLVVIKSGILIFVEIKTRARPSFGGVSSVNLSKQRRLRRAAQRFCMQRGVSGAIQFDTLVIVGSQKSTKLNIKHFRNCF